MILAQRYTAKGNYPMTVGKGEAFPSAHIPFHLGTVIGTVDASGNYAPVLQSEPDEDCFSEMSAQILHPVKVSERTEF